MDAYRKPGKRKNVPRSQQSWFMQNADGSEKGPFALEALVASGKASRLRLTTPVRPEAEAEWRPLSALMAEEAVRLEGSSSGASASAREEAPLGSFGAGLCAGLFGGIIGFALVSLMAKGTDTKRGARWGFIAQCVFGLGFRLLAAR